MKRAIDPDEVSDIDSDCDSGGGQGVLRVNYVPTWPEWLQLDETIKICGFNEDKSLDLSAAWVDLKSVAATLDYRRMRHVTHAWFRAWLRILGARNPEVDEDLDSYCAERTKVSKFGSDLVARTLEPGAQHAASLCVKQFCNVMLYRDAVNSFCEQDSGVVDVDWFLLPSHGAPLPSLGLLLTRFACQESYHNSLCELWSVVEDGAVDSTVRMLERALLVFGALCNTDQPSRDCCRWVTLARKAASTDSSVKFEHIDEFLGLLLNQDDSNGLEYAHEYFYCMEVVNPDLRALLSTMCDARTLAKRVLPPLNDKQLNDLTYLAGKEHVARAKTAHYRSLWRKWRLLWTCTSRWIQDVGVRQGALHGTVGVAAKAAYEVDMGSC